jgi:hypothetical protein
MNDPQPCPLCGCATVLLARSLDGTAVVAYCNREGCHLVGPHRKTDPAAVAAWNRLRVEPAKRKGADT